MSILENKMRFVNLSSNALYNSQTAKLRLCGSIHIDQMNGSVVMV